MTKLDLSSLTKEQAQIAQQLVGTLGAHYQTEVVDMLLDLYHRQLNDLLDIDRLEEYGSRYGCDLRELYFERFVNTDDDMEEM